MAPLILLILLPIRDVKLETLDAKLLVSNVSDTESIPVCSFFAAKEKKRDAVAPAEDVGRRGLL